MEYLYFDNNIEVKNYPELKYDIKILVVRNNPSDVKLRTSEIEQQYIIDDTAMEIICSINGLNTIDDIVYSLAEKYNESTTSISMKVLPFLEKLKKEFNIVARAQERPEYKPIIVTNHETIYPLIATIELTHKCNLKCIHCYGNYSAQCALEMPREKALTVLHDLKDMGIKIIELTGGEITVYPYLIDIVKEAINLQFDYIILLSNGYAMSEQLKQLIIENSGKIFIQIDVHSLNDDYLKWFTGNNIIADVICNNIIELTTNGVQVRVATIVTKRNIDELEIIADWAAVSGVRSLVISPVNKMGRANNADLYIETEEEIKKINAYFTNITEKHDNFLTLGKELNMNRLNCGCMTSSVSIAPDGKIKLCTMDSAEYFKNDFGNAFEMPIKEIYKSNSAFLQALFKQKQPLYNSNDCEECEHKYFCSNCILKAFIKAKEMNGNCAWYNNVSDKIKEKIAF